MKRKTKNDGDIYAMISTIQAQLAVLDKKFDDFMTKSLTELAQVLAASKPPVLKPVIIQQPAAAPPSERPGRPMYAVVCYSCGEDCEIPFKPSGNRPVYCKTCFAKRKGQAQAPRTEPSNPSAASVTPTVVLQESSAKSENVKTAVKKKTTTTPKKSVKPAAAAKKKAGKKK